MSRDLKAKWGEQGKGVGGRRAGVTLGTDPKLLQ